MSSNWEREKQFVQDVPIQDVIEAEIGKLVSNGPHLEGICPFHNDKRKGSFKVTPSKNYWKCFACGEGGDKIDFISRMYGFGFEDAVHYISSKFGFRQDNEPQKTSYQKQEKKEIQKKQEAQKASPFMLDAVYSAFAVSSKGLTPRLKSYLKENRNLDDEDMKDFFEFPSTDSTEFWSNFYKQLQEKKIRKSVLLMVPGFYVSVTPERRSYAFVDFKDAYGILCRNLEGKIVGIQIGFFEKRTDGPKYLWFSSANVEEKNMGEYGLASGAPYDILRPTGAVYPAIVITEGRYKAMAFAKTGMYTINVHGVTNLRNLKNTVAAISERFDKVPTILIGLDSDIFVNEGVARAAKNIYEFFKDTNPVYVAYWNGNFGKGFDDLVNAGHYDKVRKMRAERFIPKFADPVLKKAEEERKKFQAQRKK